ncbi:MAG: hypothetical protein ACLFS9_08630 [Nitriliruptoraceae bacterium]
MPWPLAARTALKYSPIVLEAARQLDRQLRPHLLAYGSARDVGGFVGRWTADDGVHWIVFPDPQAAPLKAFPPLTAAELAVVDAQLDRSTLKHHSELPEARVRDTGTRIAQAPARLRKRGDAG